MKLSKQTIIARIRRGWSTQDANTKDLYKREDLPINKKRCSICKNVKDRSEFTPRTDRPGQIQPHCKECDKTRSKKYRNDIRVKVISHYSEGEMECSNCKEKRIDVLDLDHINGGGIQHRKQFKTNHQMYLSIIRQGYPSGFRILCRNCNWIEWIKRKGD